MTDTPETNKFRASLDGMRAINQRDKLLYHAQKLERELGALYKLLAISDKQLDEVIVERDAAIAERNELKKALRLSGKLCHEVYHPKAMQHDYATDCPVEALIQKALQ